MAPETFDLFPRLPPEIRRAIYLLATPSRIVHIQEWPEPTWDAYQDFKEWLNETLPSDLPIHPSLADLAPYWRRYIDDVYFVLDASGLWQTTLGRYGFTIPDANKQTTTSRDPWTPSEMCPRLDPLWLSERPGLAWHLCRRTKLRSNTPIPPLLHTCRESRSVLIQYGYSIAFSTRTAEPQTWFHFERDILYVDYQPLDDSLGIRDIIDIPYSLAQFMPQDLQRVRRLALPFDFVTIGPQWESPEIVALFQHTPRALRLLPHVEELYSVKSLVYNRGTSLTVMFPYMERGRGRTVVPQPWEWIDCSEIEQSDPTNDFRECINLNLCPWQDRGSHREQSPTLSELTTQGLRNCLAAVMAHIRHTNRNPSKIPDIKMVHIQYFELYEEIDRIRKGFPSDMGWKNIMSCRASHREQGGLLQAWLKQAT
ncbi:hypothetical protein FDECE_2130 [Fusarium decemcellulare]|nr:hypothetical protein FDECE_2130 [Fusarium decemcellulare]